MTEDEEKSEVFKLLSRPAITPSDALKVLPLSRNGLYAAIARGEIKTVRLGKKILVPTGPLRQLLGVEV